MPKYEVGVVTSYYDSAVVDAEDDADALRIAREMNEKAEFPQNSGGSEVEYMVLAKIQGS